MVVDALISIGLDIQAALFYYEVDFPSIATAKVVFLHSLDPHRERCAKRKAETSFLERDILEITVEMQRQRVVSGR